MARRPPRGSSATIRASRRAVRAGSSARCTRRASRAAIRCRLGRGPWRLAVLLRRAPPFWFLWRDAPRRPGPSCSPPCLPRRGRRDLPARRRSGSRCTRASRARRATTSSTSGPRARRNGERHVVDPATASPRPPTTRRWSNGRTRRTSTRAGCFGRGGRPVRRGRPDRAFQPELRRWIRHVVVEGSASSPSTTWPATARWRGGCRRGCASSATATDERLDRRRMRCARVAAAAPAGVELNQQGRDPAAGPRRAAAARRSS